MTVTVKSINDKLPDIICGPNDMILVAQRNTGGVEILLPEPDNMDLGQCALMAAANMIARDQSFAEMMVEWGKANNIYERSIAGEYDDREK